MTRYQIHIFIATLTSLGLAIATLPWIESPNPLGDGAFWHNSANLLADGRGFLHGISYLTNGAEIQAADHPPLFIVWLAAFSVIGLDGTVAHQVATGIVAALCVPALATVGQKIGGPNVGTIVAWITAIHPVVWGWTKMTMSEPLAILMIALLLIAALRVQISAQRNILKWPQLVVLGTIFGLATLTRSELLIAGLAVVLISTASHDLRRWTFRSTAAGLVALLVVSPWVIHNLNRFEEPVLLSVGAEVTLVATNCDDVYQGKTVGYWSWRCISEGWEAAQNSLLRSGISNPDQSQLAQELDTRWRQYVSENKLQAVKVVGFRLLRAFGIYKPRVQFELDKLEGRDYPVIYGAWGLYYLLIPLSLLGASLLWRRRKIALIVLAPFATAALTIAITFGNTRYRLGADVSMIVLSALSINAVALKTRNLWNGLGEVSSEANQA
jgi:hypothetical protein